MTCSARQEGEHAALGEKPSFEEWEKHKELYLMLGILPEICPLCCRPRTSKHASYCRENESYCVDTVGETLAIHKREWK